ncbi:MAG: hypothetical protein ISS52_02020 [Dehalococcoidia bacterium]|nr:hypothetical protein [Dehalococcoidia bacterium]
MVKLITLRNARYLLLIAIVFFVSSIVVGTWPWARNYLQLIAIAFFVIIILVVAWPWIGTGFQRRTRTVSVGADISTGNYENIEWIQGPEPNNRPPVLFNRILTACSLILLTFGLLSVYLWITGRIVGQTSLSWMFFFVVFIVFPILALLDIYIWEKKCYKSGRSARAKDNTIILRGDINEVFNRCLKVIDARVRMRTNSRIIMMDRPKRIKALIGGFVISVTTRRMRDNKVRIYFLSDCQWVTTKIDFRMNQRNVDRFDRLLRLEMGLLTFEATN